DEGHGVPRHLLDGRRRGPTGGTDTEVVEGDDPMPRSDAVHDSGVPVVQDCRQAGEEDHRHPPARAELPVHEARSADIDGLGRRFKQDGIDGAGVATVMSDAGLTNGAFYAHFSSKEDLVANVLADQLRAQRQSLDAQPSDRAGLEAFVRSYLSPEHRDQFADGCPSAALLDEIARRPAPPAQSSPDELRPRLANTPPAIHRTNAEP